MVARTKDELQQEITDRLRSAKDPLITAEDVRSVLTDIVDSLADLPSILVDTTALDGIELMIDRSVSGEITIGLQAETIVHRNYLGIKATNDFLAADFTVNGMTTALVVPGSPDWPDAMRRFVAYARPTSMGDFTYVYYYPAGAPNDNSQFNAWDQAVATVELGGEDHNVLVSKGAFRDTARGRVVEAG